MGTIVFICGSIVDEAGRMHVPYETQLRLFAAQCMQTYDVTILIQAKRDKRCDALAGLRTIYDDAVPPAWADAAIPTKIQQKYAQYAQCGAMDGDYDWAFAWEGTDPYALATLVCRISAQHRGALVLEDPQRYLLPADQGFLRTVYSQIDRIDVAGESLAAALTAYAADPLFPLRTPIAAFDLPKDDTWIRAQAEAPFANPFVPGAVNLLAVARMTITSQAESLPAIIAKRRGQGENVYGYIIGDGPRKKRYHYQIALWDVDPYITLLDKQENPYPYIRHCDGVFLPDETAGGPLHEAAECLGIPVLDIEKEL